MSAPPSDARVHDLAYTRYDGERRGRLAAIWSLARWSALSALGARKSWRAKLIPIVLIGIAFVPALVALGGHAFLPKRFAFAAGSLIPYDGYLAFIGLDVLVFAAIVTPELLCPDRLDNVLSLYFSTAVDRSEYVAGKLLGAVLPLLAVTLAPVLTLFIGNVLFADSPGSYLTDHAGTGVWIVVGGLLNAVYWGALGLAIASLTKRRAVAIGMYLGLMIGSTALIQPLHYALGVDKHVLLLEPAHVPLSVAQSLLSSRNEAANLLGTGWWLSSLIAIVLASLLVLVVRYREGADG